MSSPSLRVTVAVVGSGFGGQCAALMLRKLGIEDFCLLERRSFVGGTWRQNRYPGAAVDVQSPLYCIADEPYPWSQMFAERDELEAYTEHVLTKHGLHAKTRTNCNVEGLRWIASEREWELAITGSAPVRAQFVINASGPLSNAVIPPFDGRASFGGASFHTNDWDPAFDARRKRVAVIGSGASAAQVIPAIAPMAAELHVFQRTPHWVLPRPDRTFSPLERRLLRLGPIQKALRWSIYWGLETRVVAFKYSPGALRTLAQNPAMRHLQRQVSDPALRAKLTPDYTIGCKRIILSSTLYPALCRPNVTLHDKHDAIARIDRDGIHTTQGAHVALDAIVYATGYDATDGAIPYPVVGMDGRTMADAWSEFPHAYVGTAVPGFPNLFFVTGPNTGIGHTSAVFVIESQMLYIAHCIAQTRGRGAHTVSVRPDAEQAYTAQIHAEMERTVWKTGGCRSWYQSRSGHVIAMYPGFSFEFRRRCASFKPEHHTFN